MKHFFKCLFVCHHEEKCCSDEMSRCLCRSKKRGFTLIEMIITIVVIITLSTISVPMYKNYKKDAIFAEGYLLISAIREAQRQYYSEHGNFLTYLDSSALGPDPTSYEEILGIDARGNKYFTGFVVGAGGRKNGWNEAYYFHCKVYSGEASFTLQYNLTLGQHIGYDSSWFQ